MIEIRATAKRLAMRITGVLLIGAFVLSFVSMAAQASGGEDMGVPSHMLQLAADDGGHSQHDGDAGQHAMTGCPIPCQWEAAKVSQVSAPIWLFETPWPMTKGHASGLSKIPPKRPPRAAA